MASNQDAYNKLRAEKDALAKQPGMVNPGGGFTDAFNKRSKEIDAELKKLAPTPGASGLDIVGAQHTIEREKIIANNAASTTDPNFISAIAAIKEAQATIDGYKSGASANDVMEKNYKDLVQSQKDAASAFKVTKTVQGNTAAQDVATAKQNAINQALGIPTKTPTTPSAPVQGPVAKVTTTPAQDTAATGGVTATTPTVTPVVTPTGGGTGGGVATPKPTAPVKAMTQAEAFQNFKDQYSQEAALIASDPGLKQIFDKALSATGGAWAIPKWQALYEASPYYQNHAPSYTTAEQARFGDHGAYLNAYNNMFKYVTQWAKDAGIQLDPSVLGGALPTTDLKAGVSAVHPYDPKNPTLIDDLLHQYWDTGIQHQADITRYLATKQKINPTGGYQAIGGQEFIDAQNLKAYYASMGQNAASVTGKSDPKDPTGDIYFANLAHSIAAGGTNSQTEQSKALESAKKMFPTYSGALDAGQTVQGIASPYINSLSSLLETSPNGVDLSQSTGDSQKIKNAMGAGLGQTPMSLTDFETQVRQDPRWGKTLNAQNSVESISHKILTDFGVAS